MLTLAGAGIAGEEEITLITPSPRGSVLAVHSQALFPVPAGRGCSWLVAAPAAVQSRMSLLALQPWLWHIPAALAGVGLISALPCRGHPHRALQTALGPHRGLLCVLCLPQGSKDSTHVTFELCQQLHQVLGLLLHLLGHGALPHPKVPQGAEREPAQLPPLLLIVGDKSCRDTEEISPAHPAAPQERKPCSGPG